MLYIILTFKFIEFSHVTQRGMELCVTSDYYGHEYSEKFWETTDVTQPVEKV